MHVLVDLTPLGRGGANGGAKVVAVELIRHLAKERPKARLTLLTSPDGHDELACLDDCGNVVRHLAAGRRPHAPAAAKDVCPPASMSCEAPLVSRFSLPGVVRAHAFALAQRLRAKMCGLVRRLPGDLLFCPFGTPFYHDPKRPTVSLVHDLQFAAMPRYFSNYDRHLRARHFALTAKLATHIVCISDFVRQTVLASSGRPAGQVSTIHHAMALRLETPGVQRRQAVLETLGLGSKPYLLYPANFWPHKNHAMLLCALAMLHANHPELACDLVLTGHPDRGMDELRQAATVMGLGGKVRFCGYLHNDELASLLASATGMIFPSLYEGFGLPIVEAMAAGVPVACATGSSLPEVAGDAALFFDPRQPEAMTARMAELLSSASLRERLRSKGLAQAQPFMDAKAWAQRYWGVFDQVARQARGGGQCA